MIAAPSMNQNLRRLNRVAEFVRYCDSQLKDVPVGVATHDVLVYVMNIAEVFFNEKKQGDAKKLAVQTVVRKYYATLPDADKRLDYDIEACITNGYVVHYNWVQQAWKVFKKFLKKRLSMI